MSLQNFSHDGNFLMLALDQLGSFFRMMDADPDKDVERIIEMKKRILEPLTDKFSGVLLDSNFGLPAYQQVIEDQEIQNPKPFLLRIEETGYEEVGEERVTPLRYSARELKSQGASGVKLLLYLNPLVETFQQQVEVALEVQYQSQEQKMPHFLEVLLYDTAQHPAPTEQFLVTTLEKLIDRGIKPDVWKLPFPGSAELAQEISNLVNPTPWVLLSHGTPFKRFKKDLAVCIENGASGFLAGRALWQEIGDYKGQKQETLRPVPHVVLGFLFSTLPKRFDELSAIVRA